MTSGNLNKRTNRKSKLKRIVLIILLFSVFVILIIMLTGIRDKFYNLIGKIITGKIGIGYGDSGDDLKDEDSEYNALLNKEIDSKTSKIVEEEFKSNLEEQEIKESGYFLLELLYNNGKLSLVDWSLEKGFYPTLNHEVEREYELKLFSSDDRLLYSNSFSNPGHVFSDGTDKGGVMQLNKINFFVIIPKIDGFYRFEVTNSQDEVVLQEYISKLLS